MDIPHTNIVYQFEQRVEIMSRESERTNPTNEVYERQGVILLSAGVENSRWKREITEYEITAVQLGKIRQADKVDQAELQEAHLKALATRATPFGVSLPLELESDMFNHGVALAGKDHLPLRQDQLYLPTLMPVASAKRAEPGHEWPGKIEVEGGAGKFEIAYTAKMLHRTSDNPYLQVTLKPQSSSQTIKGITLTLSPQGHLTTGIAKADGSPLYSEGDITISIRAKLERDGAPVDIEVLNCHQKFKLTRIPASFNDDFFFTAGWKQPAETKSNPP
jgi:hypothetical protein